MSPNERVGPIRSSVKSSRPGLASMVSDNFGVLDSVLSILACGYFEHLFYSRARAREG